MKDYPSIPQSTGALFREIQGAFVFDKIDGSSMRSEWSRKRGWFKHGKRTGLLDDSNPDLVVVPSLFASTLAEPLERAARDRGWQHLIVFYEFWGIKSLGGLHMIGDHKYLTVFDAAVNKQGILGPSFFLKNFADLVPTPAMLGRYNFTRGFVERVRLNEIPGITFEGVVAKAGDGHHLVRAKAKTQRWIDAILALHGTKADSIINS